MYFNPFKYGFSVMGLLIVITLAALIVGAALSMQGLIKAANIRSTVVQIQSYSSAINSFRAKYDSLPGDISKASAYGINGKYGKDGNSDTRVDDGKGSYVASGFLGELKYFWIHLSNANMLDTLYGSVDINIVKTDYPMLVLKKGGIIAYSEHSIHYWMVGVSENLGRDGLDGFTAGILEPFEAEAIDKKLDDGNPSKGSAVAIDYIEPDNVSLFANDATHCIKGPTKYNTDIFENQCTLRIRIQG